jgi:peptide deformylase
VDSGLKKIVAEMFEIMYEQKGVGLAANQVDLPYQLFVINLENDPAKGKEYVFINPVISHRTGTVEAEEGCLSFPEIYADVKRSAKVTVSAYDLFGQEVHFTTEGFFARAIQHEFDHLEGIVFIDRLSPTGRMTVEPALQNLKREFEGDRERGFIPSDQEIAARLAELEALRT